MCSGRTPFLSVATRYLRRWSTPFLGQSSIILMFGMLQKLRVMVSFALFDAVARTISPLLVLFRRLITWFTNLVLKLPNVNAGLRNSLSAQWSLIGCRGIRKLQTWLTLCRRTLVLTLLLKNSVVRHFVNVVQDLLVNCLVIVTLVRGTCLGMNSFLLGVSFVLMVLCSE